MLSKSHLSSESCGGGGSAPSSGWGKKDDEDDWRFAHRCAHTTYTSQDKASFSIRCYCASPSSSCRSDSNSITTKGATSNYTNGISNEIKTNFTNSMNVGGLHSDSKSGTLHLHIDCCRVDMEGNTNDVHDIHLRAMKAAEIINMRHGWEQPQEIRNMRKVELAEDCEHTLKDMQQFNIDRYFNLLRMKGYEVKPRYDKQRMEKQALS